MADMTREQERNELHRAIWAMADELRGSIGGWEFKSYVEAEDTRETVDIVKLNAEIEEIVAREDVLRAEIKKIIAEIEV